LKIVNVALPAIPPMIRALHPKAAKSGETIAFSARLANPAVAAVSYQWDFGDGVTEQGARVAHAYTHAGDYEVKATALGLNGLVGKDVFYLPVTGAIATQFIPSENRRYHNPAVNPCNR
jgi:hypothetical protein